MFSPWPKGFERIPDEPWAAQPVDSLARNYDTVEGHGWYRNLDRTVREIGAFVRPGHIVMDYSGGTGILAGRLLEEVSERRFGVLIVDSSPKFLRRAVDKLGEHERIAFRLIRYLKPERRLEMVHEVLPESLLERGVDVMASTNAIHLYYDLEDTLTSWRKVLRDGGRVFVQSGNMRAADMPENVWIIDETVEAVHRAAMDIVREDESLSRYRAVLDDPARMERYDKLRKKYFLPVRPVGHYVACLEEAGFHIEEVTHETLVAHVDQWYEFIVTYHEGVLGWVGGVARVEGTPPDESAVADRKALIGRALDRVFQGAPSFEAVWTHIAASTASR